MYYCLSVVTLSSGGKGALLMRLPFLLSSCDAEKEKARPKFSVDPFALYCKVKTLFLDDLLADSAVGRLHDEHIVACSKTLKAQRYSALETIPIAHESAIQRVEHSRNDHVCILDAEAICCDRGIGNDCVAVVLYLSNAAGNASALINQFELVLIVSRSRSVCIRRRCRTLRVDVHSILINADFD